MRTFNRDNTIGRLVWKPLRALLQISTMCLLLGHSRPAFAAPSIADIVAGVQAYFTKLRTCRLYCEYRCEAKPLKPGQEVAFPWKEIVFAMDNDRKFYLKHRAPHRQATGVAKVIVQESAFDGQMGMNLTGVMGYIVKEPKGVYWLDMYLQQIGYVLRPNDRERAENDPAELYWLPYCFHKGEYVVHEGQESVEGTSCYVVEAPGLDKLWIAPSQGFALLKREMTYGAETPIKFRIVNRNWREVAAGIWLPFESVREDLGRLDDPEYLGRPIVRSSIKIKALRVNQALPTGSFRLQFPIGTRVDDEFKGMVYRVSAPGVTHIDESISREQTLLSARSRKETRLAVLLLLIGTVCIVTWLAYRHSRRS